MASDEHQTMVKAAIDYFTSKGFQILHADYTGYSECPAIGRHAPDVIALDSRTGIHYVSEIETCESLHDDDTKEQFEDFSTHATENGRGRLIQFHPLVPSSCYDELIQVLRELGVYPRDNVHPLKYNR